MFIKKITCFANCQQVQTTPQLAAGNGGKEGDLFTDGFSNSDALKLSLNLRLWLGGGEGGDVSQRYRVGSTEPDAQVTV